MRKKIFPNILRARTRTIFPLWDPDPDFVSLFTPSIYSQLNQPSLLVCLPGSRGPCQMSNQPAHTKLVEHRLAPLPHLPQDQLRKDCKPGTSTAYSASHIYSTTQRKISCFSVNCSLLACSGYQCQPLRTTCPSPQTLLCPQEEL